MTDKCEWVKDIDREWYTTECGKEMRLNGWFRPPEMCPCGKPIVIKEVDDAAL